MTRPIQATLHLDALRANLELARRRAAGGRVWAVVKANAYGHGIERVFPALRQADGFAVLETAEAERLRSLGWGGPILLIEGCFGPDDLHTCERLNLWHVVHDPCQIAWLAARSKPRAHRVLLKLNTGMNRLGFAPQQYRQAWQRLHQLAQVAEVGHMTHFANADVVDGCEAALELFRSTVAGLPGETSLCNSAALLGTDIGGDWARPGIMLYGSSPTGLEPDAAHWGLQAAMSLSTRVIGVQELQPGDAIGYGSTFVARRVQRVGVAALGYADGYPRSAPSGTPIVVDGVLTTTLGRVSMDMVGVDLGPVLAAGRPATVGSPVLCWGQQNGVSLSIDRVAAACGTLGYELMCALAPRVPVRIE